MTTSSSFIGGALSFKGDKKAKKKKSKAKHDRGSYDDADKHLPPPSSMTTEEEHDDDQQDDNLTDAERKALRRKRERERRELEKVAKKSHRERIEEFNQALASVTEHNDIPRVSAAGNG